MLDKKAAVAVCQKHVLRNQSGVRFPEPYIPYIPSEWNRILVLAESQNLAPASPYVDWLRKETPEGRMRRLERRMESHGNYLGVGPWDEEDPNALKLALLSIDPSIEIEKVGVGNAVPWSFVNGPTNVRPTDGAVEKAGHFWKDPLPGFRVRPALTISLGRIAEEVVSQSSMGKHLALKFPTARNFSQVCRMFDVNELSGHYPRVGTAVEKLGYDQLPKDLPRWVTYYACHACSLHAALRGER